MKRKELTKTFMLISNWKNILVSVVYTFFFGVVSVNQVVSPMEMLFFVNFLSFEVGNRVSSSNFKWTKILPENSACHGSKQNTLLKYTFQTNGYNLIIVSNKQPQQRGLVYEQRGNVDWRHTSVWSALITTDGWRVENTSGWKTFAHPTINWAPVWPCRHVGRLWATVCENRSVFDGEVLTIQWWANANDTDTVYNRKQLLLLLLVWYCSLNPKRTDALIDPFSDIRR